MFPSRNQTNLDSRCGWSQVFIHQIKNTNTTKQKISIKQVKIAKHKKCDKLSIKQQIYKIHHKEQVIPLIKFHQSKQLTPHTSFPNSRDTKNTSEIFFKKSIYQQSYTLPKNSLHQQCGLNKTCPPIKPNIHFIFKNPEQYHQQCCFNDYPSLQKLNTEIKTSANTIKRQNEFQKVPAKKKERQLAFYFIDPPINSINQCQYSQTPSPIFIFKSQKENFGKREESPVFNQMIQRSETKNSLKAKRLSNLKRTSSFCEGEEKDKKQNKNTKLVRMNTLNAKMAESECFDSERQQDEFSEVQMPVNNCDEDFDESDDQQQQSYTDNVTFNNKNWLTKF